MSKLFFGLILGAILGALDGLTALVSAPEVRPQILGIILGSTGKGLVAGVLIGWFARKVNSLPLGILFGLAIGAALAYPFAAGVNPETGKIYFWEIMIPGSIVGMIVGYATQRYGLPAARAIVALFAVLGFAAPGHAGEAKAVTGKMAFEQLRSLAGEWQAPASGPTMVFRVTGGGTAVTETLMPGTDHEMMSVYHMDGDDLVLTHYCAGGNQPRMKLDIAASTPEKLQFAFVGGTNLDGGVSHVHQGWISVKDPNHFDAAWTAFAGDKPSGENKFVGMTRKNP
jgi:hypothetical protein